MFNETQNDAKIIKRIGYWIYEQVATYKSFWHASAMGLFCTVLGIPIVFGGRFLLERINKDVSY